MVPAIEHHAGLWLKCVYNFRRDIIASTMNIVTKQEDLDEKIILG